MNSQDKKEISLIVCDALDKIVIPQFDRIDNEFVKVRKEMKEGFKNVDKKFENFKYEIRSDFKSELDKVNTELKNVKEAIFRVGKMLSDDLKVDEKDIELLKKRVNEIDEKVRILQLAKK